MYQFTHIQRDHHVKTMNISQMVDIEKQTYIPTPSQYYRNC